MNISLTGLLATLAIGLVAGWLASLVVGGGGLLKYIVWGLLGSVVGGF
ncbi:MAG: GlsB/YeaQ/YmgE family stress response membrane protein, partial [Rhodobacterales bacterium CG_4_10_14_0_8_um_filter_70_9]